MAEKRDKLGRRYPDLDRSAIVKKSEKTKKEKYGPDFHKRVGTVGGSRSKRGYFGTLKDQGKLDELKKLSHQGNEKSNAIQAERRKRKARPISDGPRRNSVPGNTEG